MRAKLESTIISYKLQASNLIVLVESEITQKRSTKKSIFKRNRKEEKSRMMIVLPLAIYRGIT